MRVIITGESVASTSVLESITLVHLNLGWCTRFDWLHHQQLLAGEQPYLAQENVHHESTFFINAVKRLSPREGKSAMC